MSDSRLRQLEADNLSLRSDVSALELRLSRVHQRVGAARTDSADGDTAGSSTDSLEETVGALRAQVAELAHAQAEARRAAERTHHDARREINSLQVGLHELRGEMMALQQAQYYETASRLYGGRSAAAGQRPGPEIAGAAVSDGPGKDGKGTAGVSSTTSELAVPAGPQLMYTPFGTPAGYPFPQLLGAPPHPPGMLPGQQVFYGSPNMMMMQPPPPGRRFYGWPYGMYGGGTSPDGGTGPGGGTKL